MQNKPTIAEVAAAISHVRFDQEIGVGGFKIVYRAEVSGRIEAVKLVRIPEDPADPTVAENNRQRFSRELTLLISCTTPFLVKSGTLAPQELRIGAYQYVCYSEELLPGESLRARIVARHRPTQQELAILAVCLLSAVRELAGKNAVHRDIKPDNVISTSNNARPFVLLDLGLAFIVGGTNLTLDPQAIPGTRWYIAPEMLAIGFRQSLDYRADLYTVGLTLYEYATGHNPFEIPGATPMTTLYRILHAQPQPLVRLRNDLHADLCAVVDQMIKKIPALRPANLDRLIIKMEAFI